MLSASYGPSSAADVEVLRVKFSARTSRVMWLESTPLISAVLSTVLSSGYSSEVFADWLATSCESSEFDPLLVDEVLFTP